jgi:hypothetical protein
MAFETQHARASDDAHLDRGSGPHLGHGARFDRQHALHSTEHKIEQILHHNSHDYEHVYRELDKLRRQDPAHMQGDLAEINKKLHEHGLLPHLELIEDDRAGKHQKTEQGFSVVAEDKQNPKGNRTMVSTSHDAPEESSQLKKLYDSMHYKRGKYNGWGQSVEGAGGAHGGNYDRAVGGHVPEGARKELIDQALQLAGVPVTAQNEAAVNKIVQRESGWNPNITNNWDSNARAGHPSTGLMQTIPSTFKQYALEGYNTNIHDPLSNLVAGIRYAQARYARGGESGVAVVASRSGGY